MKRIDIEKQDAGFAAEISRMPGGANIRKCFACGTCTAGCPVFQVESEYNPRRIIRMILLGMKREVLSSKTIWLCSRCYTCTANCPQEVDFSNIMTVLRDMAEAGGYAPIGLSSRIERVSEAANALRADCINLMLGAGEATETDVRAAAEMLIQKTILEKGGGRT